MAASHELVLEDWSAAVLASMASWVTAAEGCVHTNGLYTCSPAMLARGKLEKISTISESCMPKLMRLVGAACARQPATPRWTSWTQPLSAHSGTCRPTTLAAPSPWAPPAATARRSQLRPRAGDLPRAPRPSRPPPSPTSASAPPPPAPPCRLACRRC